jgi:hypothetical protein
VWWLGRIEDNLRLGAAAYDAFLAESRPAEAAGTAIVLGIFYMGRGDEPQALGWLGRAGRLAEGIPESPVHGYLLSFTAVEASLMAGQPAAAVDAARRVQDLGRRVDAPDLVAVGMNGEGRALIRSGHLVDGLALLDEAMVTVMDGHLAPFISGTLYCHTIAACHEVADVRRMTRWTDLAERWLATFPAAVFFGGLCGVHRAQLLLLRGEWGEASGTRGSERPRRQPDRLRRGGLVRRSRGAPVARRPSAADAYDEAHARGRDPQPGRALLRPGRRPAGAATSVPAVAAVTDPLRQAPLCAATVEISVAARRWMTRQPQPELGRRRRPMPRPGWRRWRPPRGAPYSWRTAVPRRRCSCSARPIGWHELGGVRRRRNVRPAEVYRALGTGVRGRGGRRAGATYERLGASAGADCPTG